jgi:hypothetical protein
MKRDTPPCSCGVPGDWLASYYPRDIAAIDVWLREYSRNEEPFWRFDWPMVRIVLAAWERGGQLQGRALDLLLLCQAQAACRGAVAVGLPLCIVDEWAEAAQLLLPGPLSACLAEDLRTAMARRGPPRVRGCGGRM